jgi:hypothetical protein
MLQLPSFSGRSILVARYGLNGSYAKAVYGSNARIAASGIFRSFHHFLKFWPFSPLLAMPYAPISCVGIFRSFGYFLKFLPFFEVFE